MADKVWVFDLDDTLMNTAEIYQFVLDKACKFIGKHFGDRSPTISQLKQKQLEIDSALRTKINPVTREPYLYTMERFPLSLVETYKHFCKELNLESSHMVERELYEVGMKVYLSVKQYRKKIKKEAKIVIPFLRAQGDILVLLTKGDKRIQGRKLKALAKDGLLKYFGRHKKVVRDKNQGVFRRIKKKFSNKKRFFTVGNEYRSDIEPALREGYFGIYIPVTIAAVWDKGKLEKIEEDRDKRNSNRYSNLLEIRDKYRYL